MAGCTEWGEGTQPWPMHWQRSTSRKPAASQRGHGSGWGRQGQASQLEQRHKVRSEAVSRKVASVLPRRFPLAIAERTDGARHGIRGFLPLPRSRGALGRTQVCRKSVIK